MLYINISQGNYLALQKAKVTLNCLYILENAIEGKDITALDDMNSLSAIATLQRKGYLSTKLEHTDKGKMLYDSIATEVVIQKKEKIKDDKFNEWWEVYPSTDDFEYNGKHFKGTQKKNIKKEECLVLFNKLIHGGLDPDKIISATKYHINSAKSLSLRKGTNQLSYIANSERYLREKMFEPFIGKGESKIEEVKSNDTFI